jgi:transposase
VAIILTPGQVHDLAPAEALLAGQTARYVLADRIHDAQRLRGAITAMGAEPVIPPKPTRKHPASYNKARYRQRDQTERLVGRLKRYRRIASRYDRRAAYFLAAIHLGASLEWLR